MADSRPDDMNEMLAVKLNLEILEDQDPWSFAGEVIEAMRAKHFAMSYTDGDGFTHHAQFWYPDESRGEFWREADTGPKTIAKAALAALKSTDEEE